MKGLHAGESPFEWRLLRPEMHSASPQAGSITKQHLLHRVSAAYSRSLKTIGCYFQTLPSTTHECHNAKWEASPVSVHHSCVTCTVENRS